MAPRNSSSRRLAVGVAAIATLGLTVGSAGPAFAHSDHGSHGRSHEHSHEHSHDDSHDSPSDPSASVANNTLTITGTDGPDQITLAGTNDPNQLVVDFGGGNTQTFDRTTFNAISVSLGDGDDSFTEPAGVFADEALTVDGGRGDDQIVTGDGNDLIFGGRGDDNVRSGKGDDIVFGGSGNDFVSGEVGHDTAFLESGDDSFRWAPGEGSDFIDGGSGDDSLVFLGSSGNEIMSLSANGSRTVFLRDVGNVRMDMNDVENLQLEPLGGVDAVTINDLRGTGFRDANIDLSVAGAGDNAADTVTVNGTDRDDHVKVDADDGQVNVRGLQADVHITGSEPANDLLEISTQDGNDKVDVGDGVTSLIGVQTDLGAGQH